MLTLFMFCSRNANLANDDVKWVGRIKADSNTCGLGTGTAPGKGEKSASDSSAIAKSTADRVLALAYGAIASLPATQRAQAEAQYHNGTLARLKEAMTAWMHGTRLDQATFAARFFGRSANDPVVRNLHSAVLGAATATSRDDMREAAGKVAEAIKAVGLNRWPHLVADAVERARDPATVAAIEKSRQPPVSGSDAIRPVYPVETAIGIAVLGIVEGTVAAGRAVGGAILKQVVPESQPAAGNTAPSAAGPITAAEKPVEPALSEAGNSNPNGTTSLQSVKRPSISRQKQDGHIAGTPQNQNRMKQGTPTSTFDGNSAEADALTQEAWEKGNSVPKRPGIREYDFGRRIGEGPNGGGQSRVRVHQDSAANIHGHPAGPEVP